MSDKTNSKRKFRRRQVQQSPKGKIQQPKPFSQNEQRIISDLKVIGGMAKTNQGSVNALQVNVNDLGSQLNLFGQQMENFDKQFVRPKLDLLETQNNILTDIILSISDQMEILISEEDMKTLGLEAIEQDTDKLVKELEKEEKEEKTVKTDDLPKEGVTDKEVVAPSNKPRGRPRKAIKKKVKAVQNVET